MQECYISLMNQRVVGKDLSYCKLQEYISL